MNTHSIDGAILNDEMISEIKYAQGGLIHWSDSVCCKVIDALIDCDNYPAEERLGLIRDMRMIQDFISAFKINKEKGGEA